MDDYTLLEAWTAYESGDYELATKIWNLLIERTSDPETRQSHLLGYTYVLVAQKEFEKSREILKQLYTETNDHVYLHQLAMVERESGNYDEALDYLQQERVKLAADNAFGRASNAYEMSLIAFKQEDTEAARQHLELGLADAKKSSDPMMEGCLLRLQGDMAASAGSQEPARRAYEKARTCFEKAQDILAVGEIEIRLEALEMPPPDLEADLAAE